MSYAEGNMGDDVPIVQIGDTLALSLHYDSFNADASIFRVDTVLGIGWTHTYNLFVTEYRFDAYVHRGNGTVTKFRRTPDGRYISTAGWFERLVKLNASTYVMTTKDGTQYRFTRLTPAPFLMPGPPFYVTLITDRNGLQMQFTYNADNRLERITEPHGRAVTITYNPDKKIQSLTDPLGRVTRFEYGASSYDLQRITDPSGHSLSYAYNGAHQIVAKMDKSGNVFTFTYDVNGKPVAESDGAGNRVLGLSSTTGWAVNSSALLTQALRLYVPGTTTRVDGRGNAWQYDYDQNGAITKATAPDGAVVRYAYDPATLLLASRTDANGKTTVYQYDSRGNLTRVTDALGHTTTYAYEPVFNMLTSMTDARGRTTSYAYDAFGNRVLETDPLGQTRSWTYDADGNILSETNQNGHTTAYEYDGFGNRIRITDAFGNLRTSTYDAVGNVTSRTDANGHTTQYQYDGLNRLIRETDPAGQATHTAYDGEGNRIQIIDRNGRATTYGYDLRNRPIAVTDAVGNVETSTYDTNDNLVATMDRNGHSTIHQFDLQNRLSRTTDALGNVTTNAYDLAGNVVSRTDANGQTTVYTYDALNRRIAHTDALGKITRTGYDGGVFDGCSDCGATPGSPLTTTITDANGKVTYFKYDALERLVRRVRKVGGAADTIAPTDAVTTYAYDAVGNRITLTEPNGNMSTYGYDALNRITTMTNAAGDVSQTTYDPAGNVVGVTAPNGNVTTHTYDLLDRRIHTADSIGPVASYTYDAVGNRLSLTDGNGNATRYAYDELDRLTGTTDALGAVTAGVYDAVGNLVRKTDRNGHATTYVYDAINRRSSVTDALGFATAYQYDPVGNLTKITDANGHATQYQYDGINRLIRETFADGKSRSFAYDGIGNVITRTDQIGQVTTYSYSDLYFLLRRSYPSLVSDAYTYDLAGRMLSAQRGNWTVTFAYDGANRLLQTVQNGRTVNYSYDIPGRTRAVTYPGGRTIVEHTDVRERLAEIADASSSPIAQYTYDLGDRVLTRGYRNGTTAAYTYNANDWPVGVEHTIGVARIAGFGYAYDNEGNKQVEEKRHDPGRSEAYGYDAIDRLIEYKVGTLVGSTVPVPSTQTSYSLDPVGNWNSKTTDAVTQTRVHDAVNELIKIDAANLAYDANGNLLSDGAFSYVYDEENRLTRVTRSSDSAIVGQYQYDARGRRVVKVASPSAGFTTTLYFYDDSRILEEQNGVGTTQATYVYGNDHEVLTMDRSGKAFYYHQSGLGAVAAMSDGSAVVTERYAYDAYGSPTVFDGAGAAVAINPWGTPHSAIGNPWMFKEAMDEEAGLYADASRYFDASKGRFLQRDPFEYENGMNQYAARSTGDFFQIFQPNRNGVQPDTTDENIVCDDEDLGSHKCKKTWPTCTCTKRGTAILSAGSVDSTTWVAPTIRFALKSSGSTWECTIGENFRREIQGHEDKHAAACQARLANANRLSQEYRNLDACQSALDLWGRRMSPDPARPHPEEEGFGPGQPSCKEIARAAMHSGDCVQTGPLFGTGPGAGGCFIKGCQRGR